MILHGTGVCLIVVEYRSILIDESHTLSCFGKPVKTLHTVIFHRNSQVDGLLFQFFFQLIPKMSVEKSHNQPDADYQNHRGHRKDRAKDTLCHFSLPLTRCSYVLL